MKHTLTTYTFAALAFFAGAVAGCDSHQVKLGPAGKVYADWPFDAAEAARRRQESAAALALPAETSVDLGGQTMRFAFLPAGKFRMGSPRQERGRLGQEGPQHTVTISRVCYIARTEVTQAQWQAVMGTEPWKGKPFTKADDACAATYINWADAWAFCNKLSQKTGKTFRLPTEAEWEYACRGGTATAYCFGDSEAGLGNYAWYDQNAHSAGRKYAHRVAQKNPNAWGLYDAHGNVWEPIPWTRKDLAGARVACCEADPGTTARGTAAPFWAPAARPPAPARIRVSARGSWAFASSWSPRPGGSNACLTEASSAGGCGMHLCRGAESG